jgi:hypothetical protein
VNSKIINSRIWAGISLVIIIVFGFMTKFYSGPGANWVNNSLGGVFYEIFWCLVLFLLLPRLAAWKNATMVFCVTCLLEFLQLWHPPFLEAIRSNFIGATILGTTFAWSDFCYYLFGSAAGWKCLHILRKTESSV